MATAVGLAAPAVARGQSVVEIYQRQWYKKQAMRWIQQDGGRARVLPPTPLATSADTLVYNVRRDTATEPKPSPPITIRRVQRIPKLARRFFENRFKDQDWVFVGANRISPLDTMMTREIRARMEAQFGKPTRTLVDDDPLASVRAGDVFQFEYWFILDDDIPLVVTDVNGPFERGIAISTVDAFGSVLLDLRDALLHEVADSTRRAPFVDYYFDDELAQWYRTGYDEGQFFLEPVDRPGLSRPVLPDSSD
jgi:hypothetical protein